MTGPGAMNVVCPVCGGRVPEDMPPVDIRPHYHQHQQDDEGAAAFRVCSTTCAQKAAADPRLYRLAARNDAVAKR